MWETANLQAKSMVERSPKSLDKTVNPTRQTGQDKKGLSCYNCGREGNMRKVKNCPARRSKKCAKCLKFGHFTACCNGCRSKGGEDSKDTKGGYHGRRERASTNLVEGQDNSDNSSNDNFVLSIAYYHKVY